MANYEKAMERLGKFSQNHLLSNYEKLSGENKEKLLEQILRIDFEQVKGLYELTKNKEIPKEVEITPTPYIEKAKLSDGEKARYKEIGINELKKNNYAVLTMAGGQRYKASVIRDLRVHLY